MTVPVDTSGWSGDGEFTKALIDALGACAAVEALRVEDSPASRAESGYAFLSNEVFVTCATRLEPVRGRLFGVVPIARQRAVPALDVADLVHHLTGCDGVGAPDYQDEGMIQYLRAERVVAPWQTKGIKVVEMVRIYLAGTTPRR